ncbi:MAG: tetratricopeptide repeat protein [Candidatus Lokiarchaeota archaeon]|nr:tetratricopeptide repeat protein [Candidatus Lokiarchaeota archaeon]
MPLFRKRNKEYDKAARLLSEGKIEESIEMFRDIIRADPNDSNSMVALAVALLEVQDDPKRTSEETEEALILLDKAAKLAPDDPVPIFNRGVFYRKLGMYQEALAAFQTALEIEERQPLAVLHMAEIHYELENWEQAIDLARVALTRDPGLEYALTWVRDAMIQAGQLEDAINDIKRAKQKSS